MHDAPEVLPPPARHACQVNKGYYIVVALCYYVVMVIIWPAHLSPWLASTMYGIGNGAVAEGSLLGGGDSRQYGCWVVRP